MFDKQTVVDRIEVLADHTIAVRYVVTVTEDGLPFAEQIKGNYFKPGDDYSAENAKVQAVCAAVHTGEVIATYKELQNANPTAQIKNRLVRHLDRGAVGRAGLCRAAAGHAGAADAGRHRHCGGGASPAAYHHATYLGEIT
jgi:hypothetical protein